MGKRTNRRRDLAYGLAFLAPNLLGFLVFTLVPLVISFAMVFTNWDIRRHNMFTDESIRFIGLENLRRLFAEPDFMQYFGNTLFFMLGMPLGIAGSLGAALLLNQSPKGGRSRLWVWMLCTALLTGSCGLLVAVGMGATATTLCFLGLAAAIFAGGSAGGATVYRSLFYVPSFTAGVATMILWKKMYSPHTGPVNGGLSPVLAGLERLVNAVPPAVVRAGSVLCVALAVALILRWVWRMVREWRDGEAGLVPVLLAAALLAIPVAAARAWTPTPLAAGIVLAGGAAGAVALAAALLWRRTYTCPLDYGLSTTAIGGGTVAAVASALLGLSIVFHKLPAMAAEGLEPPNWLGAYHWAKPAIMIMGLWGAIGSGNMLLYLAGLSNISPELYEAADIDGASRRQRFWSITWPQLAPTTFFIVVMSVIGGLQGGFEMARVMTGGGPAGSTTTLSYFIYSEGFVTGRLGYASAASWAMFFMVFVVTLFNWKFGNRYTGDA
jgi:multiple sugar transport system permease protein